MKIKEIKDDRILFDNSAELTYYHDQRCCEQVYADFENIQVLTRIGVNSINSNNLEFDENLLSKIEFQKDVGFTIEDNNGIKLFVSCYNRQNGWYSSSLSLIYKDANNREYSVDISDCVKDDIY